MVCAQNHDQVGNRADGARLTTLVGLDGAKSAASAVILSPFLPLVFMGEESGEDSPFYFFTDYSEPEVAEATRKGRKKELEEQGSRFVDPQDPATFEASRSMKIGSTAGPDMETLRFYSSLIRYRKAHLDVLMDRGSCRTSVLSEENALIVRRGEGEEALLLVLVLGEKAVELGSRIQGKWRLELSSSDKAPADLASGSNRVFPGRSASAYVSDE